MMIASVFRIAVDRTTAARQLNPELVLAACMGTKFQPSKRIVTATHGEHQTGELGTRGVSRHDFHACCWLGFFQPVFKRARIGLEPGNIGELTPPKCHLIFDDSPVVLLNDSFSKLLT